MGAIHLDTSEPGVVIVTLEGEHELYGALKLQKKLESLIDEGLAVVIDLTSTTFLDSSVVSVLLRSSDRARTTRTSFAIVLDESSSESVLRTFAITGLDRILPVVPNRETALPRAG
jgi:anti-sigma B factor antagonist